MSTKGFTILDHPADLGIEARGKDLAEAFEQAAVALMSVILDVSSAKESERREVRLSADDSGQLLVKWLAEVLYLYDGKGFVGRAFSVTKLTSTRLVATIHGEPFDGRKHRTKMDVKAVTYHQLEVTRETATVRVYLDV